MTMHPGVLGRCSGWAWIWVWWRWQSRARLSRVVGPPRDHQITWCASQSEGGVVQPGQTQPAVAGGQGGLLGGGGEPADGVHRQHPPGLVQDDAVDDGVARDPGERAAADQVAVGRDSGAGALGAGELLRGGDHDDPRDRPRRTLASRGHVSAAARSSAARWWRRRGRGTQRRRRPSHRARRRGADRGSGHRRPRHPRCRRHGRSRRRGPARWRNFNPVDLVELAADQHHPGLVGRHREVPPVEGVLVVPVRAVRREHRQQVPRQVLGAAGSNLRACSVRRWSTSSRRSRTTRPGNRFSVDRPTSTCSRDTAPAARARPARAGCRCRGRSASRSSRPRTPAAGRPGTWP